MIAMATVPAMIGDFGWVGLHSVHQSVRNVSQSGQILGPWLDVQLLQHRIAAWAAEQLRDAGAWIGQVAEDDRLCWTGFLASGLNRTILHSSITLLPRLNLSVLNALNAVGALLHHPTAADSDLDRKSVV